MATIDELDIQISVQVNRAMASLNALSRQLNTVGEDLNRIGTSSGGGFSRLGTAARKINDSFSQLSLNVNKSIEEWLIIHFSIDFYYLNNST